jgi:hypothetical protein
MPGDSVSSHMLWYEAIVVPYLCEGLNLLSQAIVLFCQLGKPCCIYLESNWQMFIIAMDFDEKAYK